METSIKSCSLSIPVNAHKKKSLKLSAFWVEAEKSRFGISPAILTIVVCISAFAAAFAIMNGVLLVIMVGIPTAIFISSIIAIAPMRIIFGLAAITVFLDLIVFMLYLLG